MSKVFASLNIIALFVILSYFLAPEEYGHFRQVWLINKALIVELFALGIPYSLFYFIPSLKEEKKKTYAIQSFVMLVGLGVVVSCGLFLFAGAIASAFNNAELKSLLRIFSLFPLFTMPTLVLEGILISQRKAVAFSIYTIAEKTTLLICAVVTVLIDPRVTTLCSVILVFASCRLLVTLVLVYRNVRPLKVSFREFELGKQLSFSLPIGGANIIDVLSVELDKIMIGFFFTVTQFAKYSNGAFDIPFLGTVASSVTSALMPEYVRKREARDYAGILALWHGSIRRIALLFLPLMIFLFIFASEFISLLFSAKYADSSVVFRIYLIALLPRLTWYASILLAMGYNREPIYGSILSLLLNVLLNFILIQVVGFTGPAIATVITTYVLSGYYLFRIRTVMGVSWREVFLWGYIGKLLLISAVTALCVIPVKIYIPDSRFLGLAIGSLVYFPSIFMIMKYFRFITKDDEEFVRLAAGKVWKKLSGKPGKNRK